MRIGILSPPGKAVATIRIGARGKVLVGSVLLGLGIILGASDLTRQPFWSIDRDGACRGA